MSDHSDKSKRLPSQDVTAFIPPMGGAGAGRAGIGYQTPSLMAGGGTPVARSIPLGEFFGKYQITAVLGRGGGGAVYAAEDSLIKREVAIKMLPPEMAADPALLARFKAEAQAAGKLNHPNVVTIYEIMEHDGQYAIVMELAQGGSMQDYLERKGSPGWKASTRLAGEACKALMVAHEAGLIHRDIKPANLLLSREGHVKVADFGLAKIGGGDAKDNQMQTQAGAILGTPAFMSPEQCRGDKIDHRTDIYSLGCTYFAMLTGKPPFEAASSIQVMFSHCSAPIPNPCDLNADTPVACAEVLKKALAKDPAERYATAKDMFNDLRTVIGGGANASIMTTGQISVPELPRVPEQPVIAQPTWEQIKPQKKQSGSKTWLLVGAAATVALIAGIGITVMLNSGKGNNNPPPVARQSNPQPRPQAEKPPVAVAPRPAATQVVQAVTPVKVPETAPAAAPAPATQVAMVQPPSPPPAVIPQKVITPPPQPAPPAPVAETKPATQTPVIKKPAPFDAARLKTLQAKITNSLRQELVLIKPGKFTMGEAGLHDAPPHEVTITRPFYMGVVEVTQGDFAEIMGEPPEGMKRRDLPMPSVTWEEAAEFCRRLSDLPVEKTARHTYRLPTEAEWEYACRAGTTTRYSYGKVINKREANFGKTIDLASLRAADDGPPPTPPERPERGGPPDRGGPPNGRMRPGGPNGGQQQQRPQQQQQPKERPLDPVGFFPANAWGLKDMHGSVWEWCSDFYSPTAYKDGPSVDPVGPANGENHVARGGCWSSPADQCTSAYRNGKADVVKEKPEFGFRIVCDIPD